MLTFDGLHGNCVVALDEASNGERMPCREVVSYLRDSPRITAKSSVSLVIISDVNVAEYDEVVAALEREGYGHGGITKIGFMTEVKPVTAGKSPEPASEP